MPRRRVTVHLRLLAVVTLLTVLAAIAAFLIPAHAASVDHPKPALLAPGAIARAEVARGTSHAYRVWLRAGETFHATVEQLGVEVAVSLDRPSGRRLLALAAPDWNGGTQEIHLVAPPGEYRLTIAADSGAGAYRLCLDRPHPATERDRLLSAATIALSDGDRLRSAGKRVDAQRAYGRAATLSAQAGERRGLALALYRLGSLGEQAQSPDQALASYSEALSIWGAGVEANAVLNAIGRCQSALGWTDTALNTFQTVAEEARHKGDRLARAAALGNMAQIYTNRGEYQHALDLYREVRQTFADLRLENEEAVTLDNLAEVRFDLGAWQEGIDACEQARAIQERTGDHRNLLLSLRNLGAVYLGLKQWADARDLFEKARQLAHEEGDTTVEVGSENGLSYVYLEQGDIPRASETARTALRLARSARNLRLQANALGNLGAIEGRTFNTTKALGYFDEALRIYASQKEPGAEASILFGRAEILELAGRLDEAQSTIEKALGIVEHLRTSADGSDLRASLFASRQGYFELYIRLLMRLDALRPGRGYAARAFEASEETRARTLLDRLALANLDLRAGADPVLVRREVALEHRLGEAEQGWSRRAVHRSPGGEVALSRLDREIRERKSELEQVRAEMRQSNPRYAAIAHSRPLSLAEVQREVIDPGTLLLVYSLGEKGSFLWSVDRTSLRSYRLPERCVIETAAKQAYEALQDDDDAAADLAQLSEMLLRPAARELGGRRLLVVADGALQYVPFAALPEPRPGGLGDVLLAAHEIAYLPSASVARKLHEEEESRAPAPKELALLGDPVFGRDDERLIATLGGAPKPTLTQLSGPPGDALRSARDVGLDGLHRLPYSGQEAETIFSLVPAGRGLKAVGFDATRELAMSPELSQYGILHFATHGFLDASHPELAGLVLSMLDRQGRSRDGFLHAYEIYGLHLSADLVVLSACRTALGAEVRGEGILGLTRGFMYAGAPRVVVSLWNINDHATADLMGSFYRAMLQQHLSPAAALRAAQLATRERWKSPFRWAAFKLQGDWH